MGLGDTPALNWLGGFKESVSKAHKFCRTCEIIKGTCICNYIIIPRCIEKHKRRLNLMKMGSLERRKRLSKKFGINHPSILMDIPNLMSVPHFSKILCTFFMKEFVIWNLNVCYKQSFMNKKFLV